MSDWCARLQTKATIRPPREHRPATSQSGQVVAAGRIRIARDECVALGNAAGERRDERPHRETAAAGVDRDAVGLADQRPLPIGDEAREVVDWLKIGLRDVGSIT